MPPDFDSLRVLFPGLKTAEPLARHTSWGIGGPADAYVEVDDRDRLARLFEWALSRAVPLTPLGMGSNVLVGDRGVRGVCFRLRGEFESILFEGERVRAGAGAPLPLLAKAAAERGLTGVEPFCAIPGTLGGGLLTNAGTPEGDLGSLFVGAETMSPEGRISTVGREDAVFSYRRAKLGGGTILSVDLQLRSGDKNGILAATERQLKRRAERQPLGTKNCGSVFKNPPGDHAARLIDVAGLKGVQVGGARVSPKHANFIENRGHATAADVRELMARIQSAVRERFGVALEPEVWTLGE